MQKIIGAAALATACAWSVQAAADDAPAHRYPYVSASGLFEVPDHARNSDTGLGFQLTGGYPFNAQGWQHWALEARLYDLGRQRKLDGGTDCQRSFFLNAVRDYGEQDLHLALLPRFTPYLVLGIGAVNDSVQGSSYLNFGLDLGGGLQIPLGILHSSLRAEVLAVGENNGGPSSTYNQPQYVDYHFSLGLQVPLGWAPPSPPPPACPTVVNPLTGRRACATSDHPEYPDADGDGVTDALDRCPDTAPGFHVNAAGCALPQILIAPSLGYSNAAPTLLDASARKELDQIVAMLKGQPPMRLVIGGYTDNTLSYAEAEAVTTARAKAVAGYLAAHGIDPGRLVVRGYGYAKPVASNDSPDGRRWNRRVEFKVSFE